MNTLFRKGYLLAGVLMAANMFVVNEVKAMDTAEEGNEMNIDFGDNNQYVSINSGENDSSLESVLNFVLSRENTINLIGGTVFSGANNYFKWWDYNPGSYCNLRNGCLGWRSKKFFDTVQLDFNLNLWRGIGWLIPGIYNFIKGCIAGEKYIEPLHFSFLVAAFINDERWSTPALILSFLIQGFVSVPLAIHIFNFSISISLDAILWAGIGKFLDKGEKKE